MLYFVVIALAYALLTRRNLMLLLKIPFAAPALLFLSLGVQFLLSILPAFHMTPYWMFLPASFLLLLVGLFINRRIPGIPLIIIGCCLNCIALFTNHGRMPVLLSAIHTAGAPVLHSYDTIRHEQVDKIRVLWLVDWIPFFHYVLSPGDVFVGSGLLRVIVGNSRKRA